MFGRKWHHFYFHSENKPRKAHQPINGSHISLQRTRLSKPILLVNYMLDFISVMSTAKCGTQMLFPEQWLRLCVHHIIKCANIFFKNYIAKFIPCNRQQQLKVNYRTRYLYLVTKLAIHPSQMCAVRPSNLAHSETRVTNQINILLWPKCDSLLSSWKYHPSISSHLTCTNAN